MWGHHDEIWNLFCFFCEDFPQLFSAVIFFVSLISVAAEKF